MAPKLESAVRALGRPRVLVAGDLILDKFVWGTVDRVSPEAPIQILNVVREEFRPGCAANVARNLAALGARVTCAGVVGKDADGRKLTSALRHSRVRPALVVDPGRPTPVKTRMIAHHQQVLRIDGERTDALSPKVERSLLARVKRAAKEADVIVLSDYHKGTLTPAFCRRMLKMRRPVLVGLKGREASKYVGATGASLNRAELAALSGEGAMEKGARKILKRLRLEFLVATLGDRGIAVFRPKGKPVRLASAARQVYDVTGAGDTALAAFAIGYASGLDLRACAELANAAGGVVVGKVGTETVT
ncbi:MAG: bifunctional heptose 7-phosphate kinase/heptose 1-phosphate adenyltransferase, partial [Planctomycetota bacterium]